VLLVLGAIAAYGGYRWLEHEFMQPGPAQTPVRVRVEPGSSVRGVLQLLAVNGALKDARRTELYLRVRGIRLNIKAGDYEIPAGASAAAIAKLLEEGKVVLELLTVVEGSTFADLRKAMEAHPRIVSTLRGKSDTEVMIALGRAGEHPEGRFFPDTYRFAAGTTDLELLKLAYGQMQQLLDSAWAKRQENLPIRTPYEALILASIVEKETGLASERPTIAGVFITRLRKGMRLQTDPTVIYGIGAKYDGDIRSKDLITDTPYNTYTRPGLPPTPIALPGRESVLASVQPNETGAIFFVATGDGTGAHYFSKTLEEHNAAVQRFLARLKQRTGAPAPQTPPAAKPPSPATAQ
jgi:UPF0755 protein